MNVDLLVRRLRGGFRPFSLRLTDGRAYAVPHPEFIAVSRRVVVVVDPQGYPAHVDPLDIVSIDDKISRRNGRKRSP
jgi:hypothetical protein